MILKNRFLDEWLSFLIITEVKNCFFFLAAVSKMKSVSHLK